MTPTSASATVARVANAKDVHATLEKILLSTPFRSSAQCKKLLTYIVRHTLAAEESSLRERVIGVQVFGRNPDYDAGNDPIVRTRVAEVRKRLAQFYQSPDFAAGMVRIEIPPGSYSAVFYPTQVESAIEIGAHHPVEPASVAISSSSVGKNRRAMFVALALALFLIGAGAARFAASSFLSNASERHASGNLRTFWRGFLDAKDSPVIVFSNVDAGAGEVAGVFEVTRLLTKFQKTLRLKRGDLLTSDEAKVSSLIFLGSPFVETPLWDISLLRDFQFTHAGAGISPNSVKEAIVNLRPHMGEAALYLGPERPPFQSDYAVVALKPALTKNRVMLILAGISEYGTQAAAEFVTGEENVSDLLACLGVKSGAEMPYFEAVLHVGVSGGVPIRPALVSVHKTP